MYVNITMSTLTLRVIKIAITILHALLQDLHAAEDLGNRGKLSVKYFMNAKNNHGVGKG